MTFTGQASTVAAALEDDEVADEQEPVLEVAPFRMHDADETAGTGGTWLDTDDIEEV